MLTFAELTEKVDELSKEELEELKRIIELRWIELRRQEIVEAAEQARKEHNEGKTVVLSSPEEIKGYFMKMINDED
ncbi:hypothetical protein [Parafilimonas terrae]|uniref:Uncharacterized protein n=1 Tax=Parafilimonas terrae TaxID=1465490 RepID=A0A1I5UY81_9BACT|nr:hypothetical protein [Parafilimonas terrae]SFQ00284.1 hypothetical protein SAMN05444277_104109 [Parafilimonas terrae]